MVDLFDAIRERRDRAVEVKATYTRTDVGSNCFVVTHPDDPERTYVVDLTERTCTCEDFACFAKGAEIDCKHIMAVAEGERVALPPRREPDPGEVKFSAAMAAFDNDDAYKD